MSFFRLTALTGLLLMAILLSAADKAPAGLTLHADRELYDQLLEDIHQAQTSIHAVVYLVTPDLKRRKDIVRDLLDALIQAKKRGVEVTFLVDQKRRGGKTYSDSATAVTYLKKHGVPARMDDPNITTHSKCVVIDEKIAWLGSANWTYSAFARNHEATVRIADPSLARELQRYLVNLE